jgi:hypothetical protein
MDLHGARKLQQGVLQEIFRFKPTKSISRGKAKAITRDIFSRGSDHSDSATKFSPGNSPFDHLGIAISAIGNDIKNGHALSIIVQDHKRAGNDLIEKAREFIKRSSRVEPDVIYTGPFRALAWYNTVSDPLRMGCEVGGVLGAGTLGCFVKDKQTGETLILSNQHVLAHSLDQTQGNAIVRQPNGGTGSREVAQYLRGVALIWTADNPNTVDCAVARLRVDPTSCDTQGVCDDAGLPLTMPFGKKTATASPGLAVKKLGGRTGATTGTVTVTEVANISVQMGGRTAVFAHQIGVVSSNQFDFSDAGDSGSIIMDVDHKPVALLFAGSVPGPGGTHMTLGAPIGTTLAALDVSLL